MADDKLDQLWERIPWSQICDNPGIPCDDSKECNDLIEEQLKFLEEDPFRDPSNPYNNIVTSESGAQKSNSLGRYEAMNKRARKQQHRVTNLDAIKEQDAEQQVETRKKAIILSVMES
jgi:hypothetical protein